MNMIAIIILSLFSIYLFIRIGKIKTEYDAIKKISKGLDADVEHYRFHLQEALEELRTLRKRFYPTDEDLFPGKPDRESIHTAKLLGTDSSNPNGSYQNEWTGENKRGPKKVKISGQPGEPQIGEEGKLEEIK